MGTTHQFFTHHDLFCCRRSSSAVPSSTVSEGASSMSSMASGSSAAPSAEATASFADGLVGALYGAGLNSLAGALEPLGDDFASQLEDGNYTIFAPTDEAFGEATLNTSNTDALQEVLTYHILPGSYYDESLPTNGTHVIVPTLEGTPISFFVTEDGTTTIKVPDGEVLDEIPYENLLIKTIGTVLEVPGPIPETLNQTAGATVLGGILATYLPDVASTLNDTESQFTVFAPLNSALGPLYDTLVSLAQEDQETVASTIQSHALDSVVYSTNITDGQTASSLGGEELTFSVNDTGVFVSGNGGEAAIVGTDYIANNGVVHLIDGVLLDVESVSAQLEPSSSGAESAASSAPASASASASA